MGNLKDGIAESWAETLTSLLPDLTFYAGRRDAGVVPPFTVVVVKRLRKAEGRFSRYYAAIRVVHVSEVADSGSAEHNARVESLHHCLMNDFPQRGKDLVRGVELDGWELDDIEDAINKEDDVFGDVFMISAGCGKTEV